MDAHMKQILSVEQQVDQHKQILANYDDMLATKDECETAWRKNEIEELNGELRYG